MSEFRRGGFATTHWSLVRAAAEPETGRGAAALAELCERYWYPLYAYLRRKGMEQGDAEDRLQSFFVHILETDFLAVADPQAGRFRSFLLTSLQNFLAKGYRAQSAQRRGGGVSHVSIDLNSAEARFQREDVGQLTAEQLFDRQWAWTLIERATERLESEWATEEKSMLFAALKPLLVGEALGESYGEIAERLGRSESAVKVSAHRLRRRCGELIRAEIAATLTDHDDVETELRELFQTLGAGH